MANKYMVAEGVSLTAKGIIYKPGDEIPEGVLSEESIQKLSAAKKIVGGKEKEKETAQPVKAKAKKEEAEKAESKEEK